jgi:hypothetical protein
VKVSTLDRPTTTADPVAAAYERIRHAYAANTTPATVTVPDGWALERVGQAWSVGPTGTGTHLLVELHEIPSAIATFEQQLVHAGQLVTR